jgi:erythritol transport system ATP-binding protein
VLTINDLVLPRAAGGLTLDHVSLSIRRGEIVGIYGLLGAGRSELFECLMGRYRRMNGVIRLMGRDLRGLSIARRIELGLVLVPEDRQRDGIVPGLSVITNLTLASLKRFLRAFIIDTARERSAANEIIDTLSVKVSSPDVEVAALSGGNQQKVVIGKSLLTGPQVILCDEPTRGIDVGAKAEVFRTLRRLADDGLGVVFTTSDLKEVMGAADRILVMSHGRITGDFTRAEATEALVVEASTAGMHRGDRTTERLTA